MPLVLSATNNAQAVAKWGAKALVVSADELTRFFIGASFGYAVSEATVDSTTNFFGVDSKDITGAGWYIPTLAFALAYTITGIIQHCQKASRSAEQSEEDITDKSALSSVKAFENKILLRLGETIEYTSFAIGLAATVYNEQIKESFPKNPCGGDTETDPHFIDGRNATTIMLQLTSVFLIATALSLAAYRAENIKKNMSQARVPLLGNQNIDVKKLRSDLMKYATLNPFHNALRVSGVVSLLSNFMLIPPGYSLPTTFGTMDALLLIKIGELATGNKFVKLDSHMSRFLKFWGSYVFPIKMMNFNYVQFIHRVYNVPVNKICDISNGYFASTLIVGTIIGGYRAYSMQSSNPYKEMIVSVDQEAANGSINNTVLVRNSASDGVLESGYLPDLMEMSMGFSLNSNSNSYAASSDDESRLHISADVSEDEDAVEDLSRVVADVPPSDGATTASSDCSDSQHAVQDGQHSLTKSDDDSSESHSLSGSSTQSNAATASQSISRARRSSAPSSSASLMASRKDSPVFGASAASRSSPHSTNDTLENAAASTSNPVSTNPRRAVSQTELPTELNSVRDLLRHSAPK